MPPAVFTPKQVAQALGVSESSVKRWVDSGRLPAAKTAGGHRKVPLPSVAAFVRESGHPLSQPEVLGMVASSRGASLAESRDELFEGLINGRESACRELVVGFYQRGESFADLGDHLIGPVFRRIGDGWEAGSVQVHQERRSCEVMMAILHELRRWLPTPPDAAPLAMVATPHQDFSEVPARLIELLLLAEGWRVVVAGSGLPLDQIRDAAKTLHPRLLCLSATHLADPTAFASATITELVTPLRTELKPAPRIALGGGALDCEACETLQADLLADSLAELATYQVTVRGEAA